MPEDKKDPKKLKVKENRKENLNRLRGMRRFVDPEKGPENKS